MFDTSSRHPRASEEEGGGNVLLQFGGRMWVDGRGIASFGSLLALCGTLVCVSCVVLCCVLWVGVRTRGACSRRMGLAASHDSQEIKTINE